MTGFDIEHELNAFHAAILNGRMAERIGPWQKIHDEFTRLNKLAARLPAARVVPCIVCNLSLTLDPASDGWMRVGPGGSNHYCHRDCSPYVRPVYVLPASRPCTVCGLPCAPNPQWPGASYHWECSPFAGHWHGSEPAVPTPTTCIVCGLPVTLNPVSVAAGCHRGCAPFKDHVPTDDHSSNRRILSDLTRYCDYLARMIATVSATAGATTTPLNFANWKSQ